MVRIHSYNERVRTLRDNKLFSENHTSFYRKLDQNNSEINIENIREKIVMLSLWQNIWPLAFLHDDKVFWIQDEFDANSQEIK